MSLDTLETNSGSPYSHARHWRRVQPLPLLSAAEQQQQRQQQAEEEQELRYSRPINIVNYNRQESFDLFSAPGSPYHIRKPYAFERSRQWVEEQQKQQKHNRRKHVDSDDDDDEYEAWKSSQESGMNLDQHDLHHHHHYHHHKYHRTRTRQHAGNDDRESADDDDGDSTAGGGHRRHGERTSRAGSHIEDLEGSHFPIVLRSARSMKHLRQRVRRDPEFQGTRTIRSKRVIDKTGERNVQFLNLPQKSVRFVKDLVTTLVEEQWRYTLTVFVLSFFCSWILFAILWYLIAYAHGDLDFDPETGERLGDGAQPCVDGATSFAAFLLFSIETQVSTGYGAKTPTEECPEALFLLIVQIVIGLVIDASMVGIVYAKMIRPPKKISDMKFSRKAVICQRDGKLCFVFRLCDLKQQHAIETKVTAVLLEQRRSQEGELIEKHESYMKLENSGRILLMWPVTICHIIDRDSPLYDISAKDLLERKFEIVVTLTGGTMTTGQVTEARTSYVPSEIYWGHRFENIIHYDRAHERYVAVNEHMDVIEPVDTPLCSARRLQKVLSEVRDFLEHDREREFDGIECRSEKAGNPNVDSDSDGGLQMEQLKGVTFVPKEGNNCSNKKETTQ